MSLETAFSDLCQRLRMLRDALSSLRLTVVEDKPLHADLALLDRRADTVDDILSSAEEALNAASRGCRALKSPAKRDVARKALARCQEAFAALSLRFQSDLASYDRVAELISLGRQRGGEWRSWAASVKQALQQCEQPTCDAGQALFACWRELAERVPGVSVRATSIGQKVTTLAAPQETSR